MSISEDDLQDDGERHKIVTPLTGKALLQQLYNHRAMMAPHQKERHAGKLLLECITEIERLVQVNKDLIQGEHIYIRCAKCSNNTLRYSSTIDGLRCQHCGVAYLNCEQVEKQMAQLQDANNNLFKVARKHSVENQKLKEANKLLADMNNLLTAKNKRLELFLDGEVALVEQLGKYVKTQCCEGSPQQHEAENRMGN